LSYLDSESAIVYLFIYLPWNPHFVQDLPGELYFARGGTHQRFSSTVSFFPCRHATRIPSWPLSVCCHVHPMYIFHLHLSWRDPYSTSICWKNQGILGINAAKWLSWLRRQPCWLALMDLDTACCIAYQLVEISLLWPVPKSSGKETPPMTLKAHTIPPRNKNLVLVQINGISPGAPAPWFTLLFLFHSALPYI